MKINPVELRELRSKGWTQQRLAERYGCTRGAVSLYFSRARTRVNAPAQVKLCLCGCGVQTKRRKYASTDCYYRTVTRKPYVSWRTGQRIARRIVARLFPLQQHHIVHHEDRDNRNNHPSNLWVFESHAEHMSYHRGGLGKPIWRGDASIV